MRQDEAQLATREYGEALLSQAINVFSDKLRQMMAATEAGESWPPAQQA